MKSDTPVLAVSILLGTMSIALGSEIRMVQHCGPSTSCERCSNTLCRLKRSRLRHKPVRSCYPEVLPIHGPYFGYYESCWRQMPPQGRCLPPCYGLEGVDGEPPTLKQREGVPGEPDVELPPPSLPGSETAPKTPYEETDPVPNPIQPGASLQPWTPGMRTAALQDS